MSVLSAEERGDLAEALLPTAAHLTTLVHGDGGQRDIHQAIARLTPADRDNLLVVLAALVDPDVPMSAQLGWLHFDEHGNPLRPTVATGTTLRDLAEEVDEDGAEGDLVDEAAVQRYLAGGPVAVTDVERLAAIREAARRGLSNVQIDALRGLREGSTSSFISRARRAAEGAGRPFLEPERVATNGTAGFTERQVLEIRRRSHEDHQSDMQISLAFGVTRKSITAVVSGDTYRQYGGPIRPKRANRPTAAQRVEFAGGTPVTAQAS